MQNVSDIMPADYTLPFALSLVFPFSWVRFRVARGLLGQIPDVPAPGFPAAIIVSLEVSIKLVCALLASWSSAVDRGHQGG